MYKTLPVDNLTKSAQNILTQQHYLVDRRIYYSQHASKEDELMILHQCCSPLPQLIQNLSEMKKFTYTKCTLNSHTAAHMYIVLVAVSYCLIGRNIHHSSDLPSCVILSS
jgi:hypothetical protein